MEIKIAMKSKSFFIALNFNVIKLYLNFANYILITNQKAVGLFLKMAGRSVVLLIKKGVTTTLLSFKVSPNTHHQIRKPTPNLRAFAMIYILVIIEVGDF